MSSSQRGPVPGVRVSHGRYYRQQRQGARIVWVPLTRVADGLAALHRALADLLAAPAAVVDSVPALVAAWEAAELPRYRSRQTQVDAVRMNARIAAMLAEFRASEVTPRDVLQVLAPWRDKPRTHNAMRAQLRELMRWAELQGWRPPGSNPTAPVRTMSTPARERYLTDSELRRIKVGGWRGDDGRPTRSGPLLAALIDVLYLSGQPIGDVLALDEADVVGPLIVFRRAKVRASTGAAVRVRVSPRLRDALGRLLAIKRAELDAVQARTGARPLCPALVVTRGGQRAGSSGISSAWERARNRAGVADAHLHDIRAKALTDVERRRGMRAARVMAQHSTEQQTADYVRAREAEEVPATR